MLGAFARRAGVGAGAASAISTSGSVAADATSGLSAQSTLTFGSDGSISRAAAGTLSGAGPAAWLSPTGAGNGTGFWLRATIISGSLTSGTTGSWLAMSSARAFVLGSTTGAASCNLTIEIATDAGGVNVVASGTWSVGYSHSGTAIGSPAMVNHSAGGDFRCNVKWNADGTLTIDPGSGAVVFGGEWLSGSGATAAQCSAWELVLTYVSGANPTSGDSVHGFTTKTGAPYGSALNLGTQQSITVTASLGTNGAAVFGNLVFDAIIRPAGGGATLASARFTLSVTIG